MSKNKENSSTKKKKSFNAKFFWLNVLIVVLMALNSFTLSQSSILMGDIIDAITTGNQALFYRSLIINVVLIALGLLATFLYYRLIFYNTKEKIMGIKENIAKKDLVKDGWKNVDYSTNVDTVYDNRFIAIYDAVSLGLNVVFSVITLIVIDWRALIIGLVAGLLPLLSPLVTQKAIKKYAKSFAKKSQIFQHYIYEHLDIKDEVNRYDVEDEVFANYKGNNEEQEQSRFKLRNLLTFASIFSQSLGSVSMILIYLFGGMLVFGGLFSAGNLIQIVQLTIMLVGPLSQLAAIKAQFDSSKPIYDSFELDKEYEFKDSEKLDGGDLVLDDIHFKYGNSGRELYDGFSHTFEEGKKYLIQGDSGIGKSTLASIISGELEPDEGHVYLGKDELSRSNIKNENIGFQNQTNKLFTGTVYENINFYRDFSPAEVQNMMDELHLKPSIDQMVNLNAGLSGGEKTLISVARVMMAPREVMIFDEPTTGLNETLSKHIVDKVLDLDSTVIMISHNPDDEFKSKFDEVITLD